MSIEISFPEPPRIPDVVALHRTVDPSWSIDRVVELARSHGIVAEVADAGPWYVARDDRAALEVYQASHSLRFALISGDSELLEPASVDDGTAVELALGWLERFGRFPVDAERIFVSSAEVLVSEAPETEPKVIEVGRQVNIPFSIDALPALGPGAKAQVTIGAGDEITTAYRFWRESAAISEHRTTSVEQIFERFREARLFAGLEAGFAEVTGVRVGYYADPPTEVQRRLLPAFELTGTLHVEGADPYEFTQFAPAADLPDEKPLPRRRRLVN